MLFQTRSFPCSLPISDSLAPLYSIACVNGSVEQPYYGSSSGSMPPSKFANHQGSPPFSITLSKLEDLPVSMLPPLFMASPDLAVPTRVECGLQDSAITKPKGTANPGYSFTSFYC